MEPIVHWNAALAVRVQKTHAGRAAAATAAAAAADGAPATAAAPVPPVLRVTTKSNETTEISFENKRAEDVTQELRRRFATQ